MTYDFVVVGAGVVGMTTARELAGEGFTVALFEQGEIGREASWAAGGILSSMRPWAEHPASAVLSNEGRRVYSSFVESLFADTGVDPQYIQCGLFMAAADDIEHTRAWAETNAIRWQQDCESLTAELNLHKESIFLPDIAQVRPTRLLQALESDLSSRRVAVFANTPVQAINIEDGSWQSIQTSTSQVSAGNLVICAGAWSAKILQQQGIRLGVKPVCGQMLCVKADVPDFNQIVLDGGHYLIPRRDGNVLVGSSMEHTGFDKATTDSVKQELMHWARLTWPAFQETTLISHWAGLRPGNENGYPLIGPVPGIDGLYLNTAHFRKGILQAPVSACLLVDAVMARPSFTDIKHYAIAV